MDIQKIVKERPDSIEWRLNTGKSVKVYGNIDNPEKFKKRLLTAIRILKEIDEDGRNK